MLANDWRATVWAPSRHITRKASWHMNRGPTFSEFPPKRCLFSQNEVKP